MEITEIFQKDGKDEYIPKGWEWRELKLGKNQCSKYSLKMEIIFQKDENGEN